MAQTIKFQGLSLNQIEIAAKSDQKLMKDLTPLGPRAMLKPIAIVLVLFLLFAIIAGNLDAVVVVVVAILVTLAVFATLVNKRHMNGQFETDYFADN
ncbi:MAG TPA: hypothetical protein PLO51_05005, partial [Candidatus Micrarchaeota archaeon]|nr:hypothetical protein [Candidatus Micrarchaeota archaeon]